MFDPFVHESDQTGLDKAFVYITTVELVRVFIDFVNLSIPNTRIKSCVHNINYQIDQNEYGYYNHR